MKRLILTLGLALFLTGCVEEKVVYLNEKGEKVAPPARAMSNWSEDVSEVCIKGVVYYTFGYGSGQMLTPKIVPYGNGKPSVEEC